MVRLGYFRRVKLTFEIFSPVKIVTIFMCMFFTVLLCVVHKQLANDIYSCTCVSWIWLKCISDINLT